MRLLFLLNQWRNEGILWSLFTITSISFIDTTQRYINTSRGSSKPQWLTAKSRYKHLRST